MALRARKAISHQVADSVCDMLRSGRYRAGDRLPSEPELSAAFGVGRSTIREAVRELIALGLLEIRPGRGTFVQSLRPDLLLRGDSIGASLTDQVRNELLEVRRIVEPEAAALAAERAAEDDILRLQYDVDRLSEAVGRGIAPPEDLGFHLDLVRATHNGALWRVSGAIISFYQWDGQLPTDQDVTDHRHIFEAIRAHATQRARQLMLDHLTGPATAQRERPSS